MYCVVYKRLLFISGLLFAVYPAMLIAQTTATQSVQDAALSVEPLMSQQLRAGKLVALGDVHGSPLIVQRLLSFLENEQYWQQIDDIAVEFGNARYQTLADRFILAGEAVEMQQVRQIWRDTLYFMAWQYEVYEQLVLTLRKLNQTRQHKVRLVLAEPALNWKTLTKQDWQQHVAEREQGYFARIRTQILVPKRRGILLFGTFHLLKQPVLMANGRNFSALAALIEQQYPQQIYTLWPRMADDGVPLSTHAQPPYVIELSHSALGKHPLASLASRVHQTESLRLQQVADGYHFLENTARNAPLSKAALSDQAWHQELSRRAVIVGGRSEQQIGRWLATHVVSATE